VEQHIAQVGGAGREAGEVVLHVPAQPREGKVAARVGRVGEHPAEVLPGNAAEMRVLLDVVVVIPEHEMEVARAAEDGRYWFFLDHLPPATHSMARLMKEILLEQARHGAF